MEREIADLKRMLARQNAHAQPTPYNSWGSNTNEAAATSLLDLKSGGLDSSKGSVFKRLEDVTITHDRVQELFKRFFTLFHPFLPFLNPDRTPEMYYQRSPLLFWAIISVGARHYNAEEALYTCLSGPVSRLMWSIFAEVPQNYHVVKALVLLCTWPFPTSSTSTDSTFMLCGIMMQIALQIGLHRPNHAQDFSKFRIELRDAELQDRIKTWAVCNIVAQWCSTAYGQPSLTIYDWTLGTKVGDSKTPNYDIPAPIHDRLLIEKFSDKISKTLYTNHRDPVGLGSDEERFTYVSFLEEDLEHLQGNLQNNHDPTTQLYLRAAVVHLRLNVFFSPPNKPHYRDQLLKVYHATTAFLEACLRFESRTEVSVTQNYPTGLSLTYAPAYICSVMLASGFSLLKLMHNFLTQHGLDLQGASEMLTRTVWAIRSMSVTDNDLAERLAEVLAQVWKSGRMQLEANENATGDTETEENLSLKVRCRMSMSLVHDSVWRWRRNFQYSNGKSIEAALRKTTYPSGPPDPNAPSAVGETDGNYIDHRSSLAASSLVPAMSGLANDLNMNEFSMDFSEAAGDQVFDPLNWMLDGVVGFPYSLNPLNKPDPSTMSMTGVDEVLQ